MKITYFAFTTALLLTTATLAESVSPSPDTSGKPLTVFSYEELKTLVGKILQESPEFVETANKILRERKRAAKKSKQAALVQAHSQAIYNEENTPFLGATSGAVKLVVFFDYQCPACQSELKELSAWLQNNPEVKIILKDLPFLGEASKQLAEVALLAHSQGKHADFHARVLAHEGNLTSQNINTIAQEAGVDLSKMIEAKDKIDQLLKSHEELFQKLELASTPSLIIGNEIFGYLAKEKLDWLVKKHLDKEKNLPSPMGHEPEANPVPNPDTASVPAS